MHSTSGTLAVGVDVGGTFTDLAAVDAHGHVTTAKVLTVVHDRVAGVEQVVQEANIPSASVAYLAHGTTVVTNLLLERRGARVVVCATAGFTDLLELRRQERAALYDLSRHHPPPLVEPNDVVAVAERTSPDGVLTALTNDEATRVARVVLDAHPEIVAICLLHAYEHPGHEQQLRDVIAAECERRGAHADVVCSHDVLPEIREYERMTTTVAEAYARPTAHAYLSALTGRLANLGIRSLRVMTSSGGTLDADSASQRASSLALSGPAGGVTGAAAVLRTLGIHNALTIDIGGTSADVGLVIDGEPLVERGGGVGGVPIALPRVLVEAVAAGGGSIGWVDAGGAIRAGPHSAGAMPGPACYGRGGTEPTVTDAHVVLGNIAPGTWSGGVSIDGERAREAVTQLATRLGVSVERAADALIATTDATMARALRRLSVERGLDPRDLVLVAFGGGGPLHACGLATGLGITRIVVPPFAGVLSALGLAIAPERRERIASFLRRLDTVSDDDLSRMTRREQQHLLAGRSGASARTRHWLRARYVGQGHELDVEIHDGESGYAAAERFAAQHEARTGFTLDRAVECISIRSALIGEARELDLSRDISDSGTSARQAVEGRAIVSLGDATMLVADGWRATALPIGGFMLEQR